MPVLEPAVVLVPAVDSSSLLAKVTAAGFWWREESPPGLGPLRDRFGAGPFISSSFSGVGSPPTWLLLSSRVRGLEKGEM